MGVNDLLPGPLALLYLESAYTVSLPHGQVLALLLNRNALNVTPSNCLKGFNFSCFLYSSGYFNEIRQGGRVICAYLIHQKVSFLNVPQICFPILVLTLY